MPLGRITWAPGVMAKVRAKPGCLTHELRCCPSGRGGGSHALRRRHGERGPACELLYSPLGLSLAWVLWQDQERGW